MLPTADPYDELASMFLTGEPAREPEAGSAAGRPAVEVLLVGHLPIRAGLWLTPYADALARRQGPLALLRLDRDEPSVQLLRGAEPQHVSTTSRTLPDTIRELAALASGVLIYAGGKASLDETLSSGCDRITILSSADEAAVVNAYQLVKQICTAAETTDKPLPRLGLAVLGAAESRARHVVERINSTTRSFLDIELELVCALPQMDANIRSSCYLTFNDAPQPPLADVAQWVREVVPVHSREQKHDHDQQPQPDPDVNRNGDRDDQAQEDNRPAQEAPPMQSEHAATATTVFPPQPQDDGASSVTREEFEALHNVEHDAGTAVSKSRAGEKASRHQGIKGSREEEFIPSNTRSPDPSMAGPMSRPSRDEPVVSREQQNVDPSVSEPPLIEVIAGESLKADDVSIGSQSRRRVKMVPKPVMDIDPKAPNTAQEPDRGGLPVPLAEYVDGLTAIAPRCPDREHIELAIDRRGHLHLLGRGDALRAMQVVQTWATKHRELLRMACPEVTFADQWQVTCHLFTDQPKSVKDLHGSDVALHLLAPVEVDGKRGWYCTPLN